MVPRRIAILCNEPSADLAITAGDLLRTFRPQKRIRLVAPCIPGAKGYWHPAALRLEHRLQKVCVPSLAVGSFSQNPTASLNCESATSLANGKDVSHFQKQIFLLSRGCVKFCFLQKPSPAKGIYCRGFGKDIHETSTLGFDRCNSDCNQLFRRHF